MKKSFRLGLVLVSFVGTLSDPLGFSAARANPSDREVKSSSDAASSRATAPAGARASKGARPSPAKDAGATDPRMTQVPRGGLLSSWDTERRRWFLSARADVGFLFFRPRASFGYGIPHQSWEGVDVVPILSSTQGGIYGGLRFRRPRFEVRSGMLYSGAFYRGYLEPAASYDGRDLELRAGRAATFWAWDTELKLSAPIGPGFLQSETQPLLVFGVPEGYYVFAETIGVVVAPPWAIRQRIRYSFAVPGALGLFLGPAFEVVAVPNRPQSWVYRAGFTASFRLYQDLQLRTDVLPTVYSPDTFGRQGSAWLTINARFFWGSN